MIVVLVDSVAPHALPGELASFLVLEGDELTELKINDSLIEKAKDEDSYAEVVSPYQILRCHSLTVDIGLL